MTPSSPNDATLTNSQQAITQAVRDLRSRRGIHGLVLANGGILSYHHTVCLSIRPRADGSSYPSQNPLPEFSRDITSPAIAVKANGCAVIEVCVYVSSKRPRLTSADIHG